MPHSKTLPEKSLTDWAAALGDGSSQEDNHQLNISTCSSSHEDVHSCAGPHRHPEPLKKDHPILEDLAERIVEVMV